MRLAHEVTVFVRDERHGVRTAAGAQLDGLELLMPEDAEVTTSISSNGALAVTLTVFATDVRYVER